MTINNTRLRNLVGISFFLGLWQSLSFFGLVDEFMLPSPW